MGVVFFILILLVVDSGHFILARLMLPHLPPSTSVFYVLAIGTLEVGVFGAVTRKISFKQAKPHLWLYLAIGLLISTSTTINYNAVGWIDPGIASVLAQTGTLWGLAFGLFWLRERLSLLQIGGAALAIFGVFMVNFQSGDYLRAGSLLVILSSGLYATHTALTKKFAEGIDLAQFFFFRLLASTAFLFLMALFTGALHWPGRDAWPLLLLAGTVDVAFSRWLFYIALRRLKLSVLTILLTLSPVLSVLWSLLIFRSQPNWQQVTGGMIVLAGVLVIGLARPKVKMTEPGTTLS